MSTFPARHAKFDKSFLRISSCLLFRSSEAQTQHTRRNAPQKACSGKHFTLSDFPHEQGQEREGEEIKFPIQINLGPIFPKKASKTLELPVERFLVLNDSFTNIFKFRNTLKLAHIITEIHDSSFSSSELSGIKQSLLSLPYLKT